MVLAEPAYILLAETASGSESIDAHDIIRRITLAAEKENLSFAQALEREGEALKRISAKMTELGLVKPGEDNVKAALAWFEKPEQYCGLAAKKARSIAVKYRDIFRR